MGQVDPTAFEDVLDLQGKQVGVGKNVAAAAKHPGRGVFLDGLAQLYGEAVECTGHGAGPPLFLYQAPSPYVFVPCPNIHFLQICIRLAQAAQRWRFQVCEGSSPKRLR